MNYYKQGDAANADQIRAAFEKLGYDTSRHLFNAKSVLYFTFDGEIRATTNELFITFIKSRSEYRELELTIEPKFKVGDDIKTGNTIETIAEVDYATRSYCCESGRTIWFENQDLWHLVPKPHYDIANLKPFDKVLVRCSNDEEWMIEFYCKYDTLVHTSPYRDYPFMGIGDSYSQCIPFEGNEHLLGTTYMPDEMYINW